MKSIRQRYILFEILLPTQVLDQLTSPSSDKPFKSSVSLPHLKEKEILFTLWESLLTLFGQKTSYKAGLWMIRWDPEHRIGIIRCDNVTKLEVIASMAFISEISRIPVIFHTRTTSGTIKKTLKKWRVMFSSPPPKRQL